MCSRSCAQVAARALAVWPRPTACALPSRYARLGRDAGDTSVTPEQDAPSGPPDSSMNRDASTSTHRDPGLRTVRSTVSSRTR